MNGNGIKFEKAVKLGRPKSMDLRAPHRPLEKQVSCFPATAPADVLGNADSKLLSPLGLNNKISMKPFKLNVLMIKT